MELEKGRNINVSEKGLAVFDLIFNLMISNFNVAKFTFHAFLFVRIKCQSNIAIDDISLNLSFKIADLVP